MPTVAFHTLGCKVNHYETEAIWQLFKQEGYERVEFESSQMYISSIHVQLPIRVIKKAVK